VVAMRHLDDTHTLVEGCCWRATMTQDSPSGEFSIEDFQTLRERVIVMKTNCEHLLMDRDYLLEIGDVVVLIHTCRRELSPTHLVCPWRHNA
jgi:hypothetical protein